MRQRGIPHASLSMFASSLSNTWLQNFADMLSSSQWNTSFGTPPAQPPPASVASQNSSLSVSSSGAAEVPTLQDIQIVHSQIPNAASQQQISPHSYSTAPPVQTFVTPAMWQESVASVYEGGLKRAWDYDGSLSMSKRR